MFNDAQKFNQDISGWKTARVTNMKEMFNNAREFDKDISGWDVSGVTNMESMFLSAKKFNKNIGSWDVGKVTTLKSMFLDAPEFNQDIGGWDVSKVSNMFRTFRGASKFNQNIGTWGDKTKNVNDMSGMFAGATAFNQDISSFDVSKVTTMKEMFLDAANFNKDIGTWGEKTGNVLDMSNMFRNAKKFNQDISSFDVSKVVDMQRMFEGASAFNRDISNWDTNKVQNMNSMFKNAASFNKNLCKWKKAIHKSTDEKVDTVNMFSGSGCTDKGSPTRGLVRKVKFQQRYNHGCIPLKEVELYNRDGINTSKNKPASQSSEYPIANKHIASKAVDGDPSTYCYQKCEKGDETGTWWEVDLEDDIDVSYISINYLGWKVDVDPDIWYIEIQLLDEVGNKVGWYDTGERKIAINGSPLEIYMPSPDSTNYKWEFTLGDRYYQHFCSANCPITDISDFTDVDLLDWKDNQYSIAHPGYLRVSHDNAVEVIGSGHGESYFEALIKHIHVHITNKMLYIVCVNRYLGKY